MNLNREVMNQVDLLVDDTTVETSLEVATADVLLDSPMTMPLDQVVALVNADSVINAAEYAASFLVPGGGE